MNRAEHIERICVGSVLSNAAYLRDMVAIPSEVIQDPLTRQIYELLPTLCREAERKHVTPIEVMWSDKSNPALLYHAIKLSGNYDFDVLKNHYNIDRLTDHILHGEPNRPTNVQFEDYAKQLIKYYYGRNIATS